MNTELPQNTRIAEQIRQQRKIAKEDPNAVKYSNDHMPWNVCDRRLLAFILDQLLFFAIGQAIVYSNILAGVSWIGKDSWWLGTVFTTLYFVILDSKFGRGRSLGKFLVGIEVRHVTGKYLHPAEALIRYSPFFVYDVLARESLNGNVFSAMSEAGLSFAALLAAAIPLFALVHPYRRSFHDLMSSAVVVRTKSKFDLPNISMARDLVVFSLALMGIWIVAQGFFWQVRQLVPVRELKAVHDAVEKNYGVCCTLPYIDLMQDESLKKQVSTLIVRTRLSKPKVSLKDPDLAQRIYDSIPRNLVFVNKVDQLALEFVYGYDIGIARSDHVIIHRFKMGSIKRDEPEKPKVHYKVTPSKWQKARELKNQPPQKGEAPAKNTPPTPKIK